MLEPVLKIDFSDYTESIPAFVCIVTIPSAYSISDGILLSIICYVLMNLLCGHFRKLTPTMYVLSILIILKYIYIK